MSTPAPRRPRRPLTGSAAPVPVDRARVGRSSVRRRARGMTHAEAAAALEDARFQERQDSRREDLALDERGPAELAEWERIAQRLAGTTTAYDPDADAFVQDELAAEAERTAARETEQRQLQQLADRADEIERLVQEDRLADTEPRHGDEAVRDELAQRAPWCLEAVDAWLAHALAAHLGHYADPAARTAAADQLPPRLTAQAALLSALAHLDSSAGMDRLSFAAPLAQADPHATAQLADFLIRAQADQQRPHPLDPPSVPQRGLNGHRSAFGHLAIQPSPPRSGGTSTTTHDPTTRTY